MSNFNLRLKTRYYLLNYAKYTWLNQINSSIIRYKAYLPS